MCFAGKRGEEEGKGGGDGGADDDKEMRAETGTSGQRLTCATGSHFPTWSNTER